MSIDPLPGTVCTGQTCRHPSHGVGLDEPERSSLSGRRFPLQPSKGAPPSPLSIPWFIAEKAYSVYAAKYGRSQSLERLAERGGFGVDEMDMLFPGWREECSELAAFRLELQAARAQAADGYRQFRESQEEIEELRSKLARANELRAGAEKQAEHFLAQRERLGQACQVALETLETVGDWLGQASTREAAMDSLHRLWLALKRAGYDRDKLPKLPRSMFPNALHWRGELLHALDRAGWGAGEDGEIRRRIPGQPNYELAKGISLFEVNGLLDGKGEQRG